MSDAFRSAAGSGDRVIVTTGPVHRVVDKTVWLAYLAFATADQAVEVERNHQTVKRFMETHRDLCIAIDNRLTEVLTDAPKPGSSSVLRADGEPG